MGGYVDKRQPERMKPPDVPRAIQCGKGVQKNFSGGPIFNLPPNPRHQGIGLGLIQGIFEKFWKAGMKRNLG